MNRSPWIVCIVAILFFAGFTNGMGAVPNYSDPAGYPTAWPAQMTTQAYTRQGQPDYDVMGNPDGSKGSAPQGATDFSSGPLNNQPSFYYYGNGATLYFRVRIAGPPTALSGSGQPYTSATWNFLLDTDADGYKEFVIEVDGTDSGTQPDDIVVIYDNSNSQRFVIGAAGVWRQDSARHPTDRTGDGVNGESGTAANWDRDTDAYVWDFGRTRVTQLDRTQAPGAQNSEYFLDVQVPLAALDATALGGPVLTGMTPFTLAVTSSNSNTDPTQKDIIIAGDFAMGDVPLPSGDLTNGNGATMQAPIIRSVTSTSCPSPILLSTTVLDATTIVNGVTKDTLSSVRFEYYYDSNRNGLADDSNAWTLAGNAARTTTLGLWTYSWNAAVLYSGQYLIRSIAVDNQGNTTTSTEQPATYPNGVFAIFNHACGVVARKLTGRVYEDVNYGGGAGRAMLASSGIGRSNARVEVYDSSGAFVRAVTTDASGNYSVAPLPSASYSVRAVSGSVDSSRSPGTAGVVPVLTFRYDASSGSLVAVTDRVGGENPALSDAGANTTGATLASLTTASTAPQALSSVNLTNGDVAGLDFGFNFSTVTHTRNSGAGTLRQVLSNANALLNGGLAQVGRTAGIENVIFMISNGTASAGLRVANNYFANGVTTITPITALPTITDPVIIDGTRQPGWSDTPVIQINGATAGGDGLTLAAGGSTIRGLAINRFSGSGILISGTGSNTIIGNRLGTTPAGTAALPNGTGLTVLGSNSNVLGGTAAADVNVISGNTAAGVSITGSASSNRIIGNSIGTAADGATLLPNGGAGVNLAATGNTVGGTLTGEANRIAGNGAGGVIVATTASGNAIRRNAIWANVGPGIDLGANGVTANDGALGGANNGFDYPVIAVASFANGTLTVQGYIGSASGQSSFGGATIEFFKVDNSPADQSGEVIAGDGRSVPHGEGRTYIGTLTANANGTFQGSFSASGLVLGDFFTATATNSAGNTSEFSANASTIGGGISGFVYNDINRNGQKDSNEVGTSLPLFVKLVDAASATGPAIAAVSVNPATGAYSFQSILPGTYTLILDDNATPTDVSPAALSGWTRTQASGGTRSPVAVTTLPVEEQNFGIVGGVTLLGRVFRDTGTGSGVANDGVLNGGEGGIGGAVVKLTNAAGTTVYSSALTDSDGNYALLIPNTLATGTSLRVTETNPNGLLSTGATTGNTGGSYSRATDTITFTLAANMIYSGVNFGDVPVSVLTPDGQQSGLPGTTIIYPHLFTAGSAGVVSFSTASAASPVLAGWNATLFRDLNSDGHLDAGDPAVTGPINVAAGENIRLLVKQFIPSEAAFGAKNDLTLTASFTYTGAIPALTVALTRHDLTTVGTPATAGLVLLKSVDKTTARPGEKITYTITFSNNSSEPLGNLSVFDATPAYSLFASATHETLPAGISGVTVTTPAVGAAGPLRWTFTGTLAPGGQGSVSFSVTIEQ